jgi:hypothetical protein
MGRGLGVGGWGLGIRGQGSGIGGQELVVRVKGLEIKV